MSCRFLFLVAIVACETPLPTTNLEIPRQYRQDYEREQRGLSVHENSIVLRQGDYDRIAIVEAHMDGDAYVGTKLFHAHEGDSGWETEPMEGTVRFDDGTLTIELRGTLADAWNGEYDTEASIRQRENAHLREQRAPAARMWTPSSTSCASWGTPTWRPTKG